MTTGLTKEYEDDFTENEVMAALEGAGLNPKDNGRYFIARCPLHEDSRPSAQIFKDDWFVNCLAQCGRYHITKAFPELRHNGVLSFHRIQRGGPRQSSKRPMIKQEHKTYELFDAWQKMPNLEAGFSLKGIPRDVFDDLGWRRYTGGVEGLAGGGIFIPYFSANKTSIPFGQIRHETGERRFSFLKDAKPTAYGKWNLEDGGKVFLVEGASDAAVMQYCAIPWVAMPSASSGTILTKMAEYCLARDISIVYAGDRDAAGDKLKEALGKVMTFRVCQVPEPHKDWGEFLVETDMETVFNYCKDIWLE